MATARMKAQNRLNAFLSFVASMERTGNAMGRLVLIWATVVVGFSKKLDEHFGYLAVIIILESFRAFSRESKSDDQLLFKTTGSIKFKRVSLPNGSLYYVNTMIIASFWFGGIILVLNVSSSVLHLKLGVGLGGYIPVQITIGIPILLSVLVFLSKASEPFLPNLIEKASSPGSSPWFKFSPPVALLAAGLTRIRFDEVRTVVLALFAIAQWCLFYYVETVQLPAAHPWMQKYYRPWMQKYLSRLLITGIVGTMWGAFQLVGIMTMVAPLVLGNFQFPLSMTRIVLGFSRLFGGEFGKLELEDSKNGTHVVKTLKALYIMLICQGMLYILACVLESFSYFFRATLARHCGLVDEMGEKSIDHYYQHAYETFVQDSVLGTKEMNLVNFAVDTVNSDVSRDKKLAAVLILNSFLQQDEEACNREVASQVTASTKAVSTLISMLGWTVPEGVSPTKEKEEVKDADVRLFSAKVVADLAPYLRIVGIPGTMQMVCSLLDVQNQPIGERSSAQIVEGSGGTAHQHLTDTSGSPRGDGNGGNADNPGTEMEQMRDASGQAVDLEQGDGDNQDQPLRQDSSTQAAGDSDSLEDEVSIPVLGMLILERLAHDVDNCVEISRSTQILPKIIGFISHITDTTGLQKKIVTSSLRLVAKLASVNGEIGLKIRKDLSKNPLLPSKLAEILEDSCSGPEQWKPAMEIIAMLAMDEETRQEIEGIQMIISKLMHTFPRQDEPPNTCNDPSLRKAAGEALAMLTMDNTGNCSAMLNEQGYELTKNLMHMLLIWNADGEYVYHAAILLQRMFSANSHHQDPTKDILSALSAVLKRIMKPDSKGKQLEALIGLASQIYTLVPNITCPQIPLPDDGGITQEQLPDDGGIAQEQLPDAWVIAQVPLPDDGGIAHVRLPNDGALAKKLVDELNANKRPSTEFPNMRRGLVELVISMLRSRPAYAEAFRINDMLEALSIVEKTPSKVERYRLFSGTVGLFPVREEDTTLSTLAAEARGLINRACS